MADGPLGDLQIVVGGDISPFEDALAQIQPALARVSAQIDDAFSGTGASSAAVGDFQAIGDAASSAERDLAAL
jgi:hypothetical protein